jgi:hypothetical protein
VISYEVGARVALTSDEKKKAATLYGLDLDRAEPFLPVMPENPRERGQKPDFRPQRQVNRGPILEDRPLQNCQSEVEVVP